MKKLYRTKNHPFTYPCGNIWIKIVVLTFSCNSLDLKSCAGVLNTRDTQEAAPSCIEPIYPRIHILGF